MRNVAKPFPLRWMPRRVDWDDPAALDPIFDALEKEASTADLPRWLAHWSEFECAFNEQSGRRYVAMTCDTEDPRKEKSYLHFETVVSSAAKPRWQKLKKLYLDHPRRRRLPKATYGVMDKFIANEFALYRDANVPLEAEDAELRQKYQKLVGAMTVRFDGRERTLAQMGKVLEETDRDRRRQAFELVAKRRLQDRDALEDLYDKMVALRTALARNAGFENYRDYAFRAKGRFDYTPRHCFDFHRANEKVVVPALRARHAARKKALGVDVLRPWDLAVDPLGRPPLRPFRTSKELADGCSRIFRKVHPDFQKMFELIRKKGYLDLDSRKGKAPGGYQTVFEVERAPFIFTNAAGRHQDVETLLHEGGHAFHSLQCRHLEPRFNRDYPTEFAEVASMGMELLGQPHLEEFYAPEEADRARAEHLEGLLTTYPWVATIDAFQHWVYTDPGHSRTDRRNAWVELRRRLGGAEDWTGYEEALAHNWHRQLHLFTVPFYYIEYGIAQTGALQVWRNARTKGAAAAIAAYRKAEALGWTRPLPELFKAGGLRFDFSERTIRPLIALALADLEKLDG